MSTIAHDYLIFCYKYKGMDFHVVAQPIVSNSSGKITAVELLPKCYKEACFDGLYLESGVNDLAEMACIKMQALSNIVLDFRRFNMHINIDVSALLNSEFISAAMNNHHRFSFEVKGFDYDYELMQKVRSAISKLKEYGHEVWLDHFGVNSSSLCTLFDYPWSGIKIDKEIVWRSSMHQLLLIVEVCKCHVSKIILDGIESNDLLSLSKISMATESQGYHWPLLKRNDFFALNKKLRSLSKGFYNN